MIIITGSYPPEQCGVADYCFNLMQTETAKQHKWKIAYTKNTSLRALRKTIKYINGLNDNLLNIQYPSRGYVKSIFPHLLCLYYKLFTKKTVTITIHEFSQIGWKGKLCAYIFLLLADKIIFTNEFEQNAAYNHSKCTKKKSTIIKIYSNIPLTTNFIKASDRKYDIGYFGFLRPLKGLEQFITDIASLKRSNPNIKTYIMGQVFSECRQYAEKIKQDAIKANIEIFENVENSEVANIIGNTKIGFLPYPDGLSERRGSFMAFAGNSAIIVSSDGCFVTEAHRKAFCITTPDSSLECLKKLLESDDNTLNKLQQKTIEYTKTELPASWNDVAVQYQIFLQDSTNLQ
ncbi:MAG: glycosyltransferase family 1 protein [Paludibacteraceae bacterium]|nr:glycosyltransferase family 1 protein [Paludibacteraceae bacterium]